MARYAKISTIGARPPVGNPGAGEKAVQQMIAYWEREFAQVLPDRPDLILVPECCDRYPAHSLEERLEYYRFRGDRVRDFFATVARANNTYIAYPAIRQAEDHTWRNSVQLLDREGELAGVYNKNFPVITETTQQNILCGADAPVFDCDFGRVGCAICFDLNFDEIRLRYVQSRPEVILFPSMYHGGLMQAYWAYSCRAHLVTAVCGLPSAILSPVGHPVAQTTNYFDFVTATVNLDCKVAHLDFNWEKLKAMRDKYGPEVRVFDPGFLGSVLISSESDKRTCAELIEEFGIELLDQYMARSMAHRRDPENVEQVLVEVG
jgi:predicted amidohydrolase